METSNINNTNNNNIEKSQNVKEGSMRMLTQEGEKSELKAILSLKHDEASSASKSAIILSYTFTYFMHADFFPQNRRKCTRRWWVLN